jgi:hypothetical protein
MDAYAKTVLTVIAVCLLLLVAKGFGLTGPPETGPEPAGRYLLQPIPMARLLIRMDRVTGRTWTTSIKGEDADLWMPIDEVPADPAEE